MKEIKWTKKMDSKMMYMSKAPVFSVGDDVEKEVVDIVNQSLNSFHLDDCFWAYHSHNYVTNDYDENYTLSPSNSADILRITKIVNMEVEPYSWLFKKYYKITKLPECYAISANTKKECQIINLTHRFSNPDSLFSLAPFVDFIFMWKKQEFAKRINSIKYASKGEMLEYFNKLEEHRKESERIMLLRKKDEERIKEQQRQIAQEKERLAKDKSLDDIWK